MRLIRKWLTAGVVEHGHSTAVQVGTPQGAVISPLLANIYLHYVFDLWTQRWRLRQAKGDMMVIRYADDSVLGFESKNDVDRFLENYGFGSLNRQTAGHGAGPAVTRPL